MNRADDLKTLQEARPFLRSALAFMVFMRLVPLVHEGGAEPTDRSQSSVMN